MKILQLNVWTGRISGALVRFFRENDFDVICLQEVVWGESGLLENFAVTADQLKEYSGLKYDFRSSNWEVAAFGAKIQQGNMILSREKIIEQRTEVTAGEFLELRHMDDMKGHSYTLQIVKLESGLNIVNHHGYWLPTPLGDENTVKSMKNAANWVKKLSGPVVMCGDLNISPESPAMRELDFLRDLTAEKKVRNTLSGLKFNGEVACDHILVNDQVKVKKFEVLDDLVSDHKALVIEID